MTSWAMGETQGTGSTERALRWVGDLDHPFYSDERQRFIWYEASAIGFQLFLFANLAILGIAAWVGGASALPYVVPFFILQTVIASVVLGYVKNKHAEYVPNTTDMSSPRMLLYLGLLAFVVSGIARGLWGLDADQTSGGFVGGFVEGARFGAIAAVVGILIGVIVAVRKSRDAAG